MMEETPLEPERLAKIYMENRMKCKIKGKRPTPVIWNYREASVIYGGDQVRLNEFVRAITSDANTELTDTEKKAFQSRVQMVDRLRRLRTP